MAYKMTICDGTLCYTNKMTICDDLLRMLMNEKTHYNNDFRERLRAIITQSKGHVFSRSDLSQEHSNKEQLRLNRALRAFMDEGFIIKIAHGLFAKAQPMQFPDRKIRPVLTESFETIAIEALDKLGVQWELGRAIRDYNEGKTTQVPALFSVRLKSRFRGSIQAQNQKLVFEGNVNAR